MVDRRTRTGGLARDEAGSALVLVLLALSTIGLLAGALVVLTSGEALIALRHREAEEAAAAARALAEVVVSELRQAPDWDLVLSGGSSSWFHDSAPAWWPDGTPIDPAAETARLQEWSAATEPWGGAGNPRWLLFALGPVDALLAGQDSASTLHLFAWVADDGADGDGVAERDSNDVIRIRAEARGVSGLLRGVSATLGRVEPAPAPLRRLAWREGN
jgi:type II secretory pathway pseudopilin PulG